ncbi:MAG TPA: hypothetical protein VN956_15175 [Pyrinomonadaceae bacterium]|nr:hypothetical protein [Pyrinomonadaceae bacterium]
MKIVHCDVDGLPNLRSSSHFRSSAGANIELAQGWTLPLSNEVLFGRGDPSNEEILARLQTKVQGM